MPTAPEGTPCWADAMFPDFEAAKRFYGELFGWTFGEAAAEFGQYTQAYVGDRAVAALSPRQEGSDTPPAWNLYLATPDAAATAARIREHGGEVLVDPMRVADFGTMVVARDPSGVHFSAWQPGTHEGFGVTGRPGSYAWADLCTREVAKADAFFPAVFPFGVRRLDQEEVDFRLWDVGGDPVLGRMAMGSDFPPDVPPYLNVHFAVGNVDAALTTVDGLGGRLLYGPMDSPFGRFATVSDQQGAVFTVIDPETRVGEVPPFVTA
ncbi:VOC family protein [Streptomyces sp. NPDC057638]|uniref:VOC family protein n=1 Tax=Streptomyces sp. NPDC057638 TaxID=3346190 RepID=UPI00369F0250